ncbi:porin [Caulobacter segnis]
MGRFAFIPAKGYDWLIHVGANASVVATPAQTTALTGAYAVTIQDRPELRVDGQQLVSTGAIDAKGARHYGLEFAAQKKNLLIQGEYFDYKIDRRNPAAGVTDPKFTGWYVEGGWVLTGEARKYNPNTFAFDAPAIANPFDPKAGKWGAWELAGPLLGAGSEPSRERRPGRRPRARRRADHLDGRPELVPQFGDQVLDRLPGRGYRSQGSRRRPAAAEPELPGGQLPQPVRVLAPEGRPPRRLSSQT